MSSKAIKYKTITLGERNNEYAKMSADEQAWVLRMLKHGLLKLVEESNHNPNADEVLKYRNEIFLKHQSAPKPGTYNSLGSFCSGVLAQTMYNTNNHISIKQLPGIQGAMTIFCDRWPHDQRLRDIKFVNSQDPRWMPPDFEV